VVYQGGFVELLTINSSRRSNGQFYNSCIPDVYSGIAVARSVKNYVFSHEPFAINGASKHSNGVSYLRQNVAQPADTLRPIQQFMSEGNIEFHRHVPTCADGSYPKSVQALVYEAYLQAIDESRGTEAMSDAQPARQLELILTAGDSSNQESLCAWGRIFAIKHNIDFDAAYRKAIQRKPAARARELKRLVLSELDIQRVGSPQTPIKDVYDASLTAAEILRNKPAKLAIAGRITKRVLEKLGRADTH
jgi:hypothetical protein